MTHVFGNLQRVLEIVVYPISGHVPVEEARQVAEAPGKIRSADSVGDLLLRICDFSRALTKSLAIVKEKSGAPTRRLGGAAHRLGVKRNSVVERDSG